MNLARCQDVEGGIVDTMFDDLAVPAGAVSPLYAGVGSRRTPPEVLRVMRQAGRRLATLGFTLRSGAADGADAAFEAGCDEARGAKEIWLPWSGFNGHEDAHLPGEAHMALASRLHPAWTRLGAGARRLHARNMGQVLGEDLRTPVAFVLCWTSDGCESAARRARETGGTGMAIAAASESGIPVFNLCNDGALERLAPLVRRLRSRAPA